MCRPYREPAAPPARTPVRTRHITGSAPPIRDKTPARGCGSNEKSLIVPRAGALRTFTGLRQLELLGWTVPYGRPCAGPRGQPWPRTRRRQRRCPVGAGEPEVAGAQRAGAAAAAERRHPRHPAHRAVPAGGRPGRGRAQMGSRRARAHLLRHGPRRAAARAQPSRGRGGGPCPGGEILPPRGKPRAGGRLGRTGNPAGPFSRAGPVHRQRNRSDAAGVAARPGGDRPGPDRQAGRALPRLARSGGRGRRCALRPAGHRRAAPSDRRAR